MHQKFLPEPHWIDEKDWLCAVELFPTDDPEARLFAADVVGYLMGYAHLTDTRSLALVGDPADNAYEFLFSFSSPEGKKQFLELIRSNEDLGEAYIENDLIFPTLEEIRRARPVAKVLRRIEMFGRMTISPVLQLNPNSHLESAVGTLLQAAEQPEIFRWRA